MIAALSLFTSCDAGQDPERRRPARRRRTVFGTRGTAHTQARLAASPRSYLVRGETKIVRVLQA